MKAFRELLNWKPVEECIEVFGNIACKELQMQTSAVCDGIVKVAGVKLLIYFILSYFILEIKSYNKC